MEEIWKPVAGYVGLYEVSTLGRVRRLAGSCRVFVTRIRKLVLRNGYLQILLSKKGRVSLRWVHRLVAVAFVKRKPRCRFVNHLDGNRTNNVPSNLEWTTHAGNIAHAYRIGLMVATPVCGSRNGSARLDEAKVRDIKNRIGKETLEAIGNRHGVNKTTISRIKLGKSWQHV